MAAQPIIVTAIGSKSPTDTLILALIRTTTRGVVQIRAYPGSGSCTTEDTAMRENWCVERQDSTYISNLYQRIVAYKQATTTANLACIRTYACTAEDCDLSTCTPAAGYTSELTNVSVSNASGLNPPPVDTLTLTPGDGKITASWTSDNPTVWAFAIKLLQGTTTLANGYITSTSVTIGNLTNGTEYTVQIWVRSYDDYLSTSVSKKETPAACSALNCNIGIV